MENKKNMIELLSSLKNRYTLSFSVQKLLHSTFSHEIEAVATIFYQKFSEKMLSIKINNLLPNLFPENLDREMKEEYKNLFQRIPKNKAKIMDQIICMICLISDQLFEEIQHSETKSMTFFLKKLNEISLKTRELAFIYFNEISIGFRVGKQAAQKFFSHYFKKSCSNQIRDSTSYRRLYKVKLSQKNTSNEQISQNKDEKTRFIESICQLLKTKKERKKYIHSSKSLMDEGKSRKKIYLLENRENRNGKTIKFWQNKIIEMKNNQRKNVREKFKRYKSYHQDGEKTAFDNYHYRDKKEYTESPKTFKLPQIRFNTLETEKGNDLYDIKVSQQPSKYESFNFPLFQTVKCLLPKKVSELKKAKKKFLVERQKINYE